MNQGIAYCGVWGSGLVFRASGMTWTWVWERLALLGVEGCFGFGALGRGFASQCGAPGCSISRLGFRV